MKWKQVLPNLGLTLILAVWLQVPGAPSPGAAYAADEPKPVTITEADAKDNKAKAELVVGQELILKLKMQGGTGFTWSVAKHDEKVIEIGKPTTEKIKEDGKDKDKEKDKDKDKDKPIVGGAVLQVIKCKALKEGATTIELEYKRPFEKDAKPAKTFTVEVTVKKAK